MARDQIVVDVTCRGIPVYANLALRDVDGSGGFLYSDSPMPVGTMLLLSPARNRELTVPARVALVVEVCRSARSPTEQPGMNLTFEEASERLLDYLEETELPVASPPLVVAPELPVTSPPLVVAPPPPPVVAPPLVVAPPRPLISMPTAPGRAWDSDEIPTVVEPPMFVRVPPVEEQGTPARGTARGSIVAAPPELREIVAPPPEASVIIAAVREASVIVAAQPEPSVIVAEEARPTSAPTSAPAADEDPDAPDKLIVEMEADYGDEGEEGEEEEEKDDKAGKTADTAAEEKKKKRRRGGRGRKGKKPA